MKIYINNRVKLLSDKYSIVNDRILYDSGLQV